MSEANVNNSKTVESIPDFSHVSVKETLAKPEVQDVLKKSLNIPQNYFIKKVSKPSTEFHTQKIDALTGTTLEDAQSVKFTIFDETGKQFLDPVQAINKKYQIIDYVIGLEANIDKDKKFQGYSATGFKLTVHKLEEVKGGK